MVLTLVELRAEQISKYTANKQTGYRVKQGAQRKQSLCDWKGMGTSFSTWTGSDSPVETLKEESA